MPLRTAEYYFQNLNNRVLSKNTGIKSEDYIIKHFCGEQDFSIEESSAAETSACSIYDTSYHISHFVHNMGKNPYNKEFCSAA